MSVHETIERRVSTEWQPDSDARPIVGGEIQSPAFCLLAGVYTANDDALEVVSIPLTKLPATIGRSHDTEDAHFFGLGTRKALSRQQAVIYFRDRFGGRIIADPEDPEKLVYRRPEKRSKETTNKPVLREDTRSDLPSEGFFVIECVGKNRIFVNQQRVDPGEVALLENGSRIRMCAYNLYFLLPTDTVTKQEPIYIPNLDFKKRKPPPFTPSHAAVDQHESKKSYTGGFGAVAKALEDTTAEELMVEMDYAIKGKSWERRQQMIGSAVLLHAVRDAARSATLQQLAKTNNGLSRSEILDKIKQTDKYRHWVDQMLTKMEFKSYQANTSKALTKAGFVRTGTTGRHVKWILPDLGISDDDIFATIGGGVDSPDDDDEGADEENNDDINEDIRGENESDDDIGDGQDDEGEGEGEEDENENEGEMEEDADDDDNDDEDDNNDDNNQMEETIKNVVGGDELAD